MPTFRCTAPSGLLDTKRRAAIARETPRIYQAVTGVAADFTLVISHRATAQPLDEATSAALPITLRRRRSGPMTTQFSSGATEMDPRCS